MPDSNMIITVLLVVILFFAVKNSIPHFKGEGACCGGGSKGKKLKPQKLEHVTAQKKMRIEGMMCDNCALRIHNALNSIDGVNAKVIRSKDMAVIRLGREMDDAILIKAVSDLGYTVKEIGE